MRAASLTLARSAQYLSPGVVLAVVDPGVGTDRRRVAVEVGEGESVLVGPDNGLLAPAVAMVGGATRVVSLTDEEFHLPAPGATFDGHRAVALGLGSRVLDAAEVLPAALELAHDIAVNSAPASVAASKRLLWESFDLDRAEEGLAAGMRALEIAPDHPDAHYVVGAVLMALRRFEEAERRLRQTLELAPEHSPALNDLAVLLIDAGRRDEARPLLERALEVNPEDPVARGNLAKLTGG